MTSGAFVTELASCSLPNVFNPYRDVCPFELSGSGPKARRKRLEEHLSVTAAELLIIGEAPGYRGARYTGLAFTSERLLLEGAIPRVPDLHHQRISNRKLPWSEPSATIVWKALHQYGLAESALLFNAFPFHPEGKSGPHSNRPPTEKERAFGLEFLELVLDSFICTRVVALGVTASRSLDQMGVSHIPLRHPANGGATKFRNGLATLF